MNIARLERILGTYQRIEGKMSDRQEAIARQRECRKDRIVKFVTTDWQELLDAAAIRADAADDQAREALGMIEDGIGPYNVSHSWDVSFTGVDPDGGTYTEVETGGYQRWYFDSLDNAETYASLLKARFAADSNYDVSVFPTVR